MGWRLRRLGRGVTTLDDSACVSAALTLNRLTAPISACFPPAGRRADDSDRGCYKNWVTGWRMRDGAPQKFRKLGAG